MMGRRFISHWDGAAVTLWTFPRPAYGFWFPRKDSEFRCNMHCLKSPVSDVGTLPKMVRFERSFYPVRQSFGGLLWCNEPIGQFFTLKTSRGYFFGAEHSSSFWS